MIEGDTSFIKPWDQDFAVNNGYVVGSQVTHNGITWEQVWDRTCWWEEPGTNESIWKEVETNVNPEASNSDIYLTETTYLVYNEEDGYYSITEGFTSLSGGVNSKYSVSSITAEVYIGQLCVYSETMTGSNKFNLDNISLLQGANFLKITSETIDNQTLEAEFIILNFTEDNIGDFEPDMEDNDGDGLSNYYEDILGTDKNNADTDGDGLTDLEELELTATDPTKVDTDDNGIWDCDEDFDNDGLTDLEEVKLGTSPMDADTDGDNIPDGEEVQLGTNPLIADSDSDGVEDGDELRFGLNPLKQDSFDDGIIDGDRNFSHTIFNEDEDNSITTYIFVDGTIEEINNSYVTSVSENDIFLNNEIPGYLSNAFDIFIDGNAEAYATFELDEVLFSNPDIVPAVYFWNEEIQFLEKLDCIPSTRAAITESITIKIQESGKLIVVDSNDYDAIWEIDLMSPNSTQTGDIDIVFTIDSSGSMTSMDPTGIRKTATIDFINLLSDTDQGAVVDFDSTAKLLQGLTSNKEDLIAAVNKIDSSGGTNIYNGLNLALQQFSYLNTFTNLQPYYNSDLIVTEISPLAVDEYGDVGDMESSIFSVFEEETREANRYIFLMTDGQGTATNYKTLTDIAEEKNVLVYCVGLGSGVDTSLMTAIAKATKGKYVHANNTDELNTIFLGLSEDLTDYHKDSDGDMLNDYYEKKIASGELRLGTGAPLGNVKWYDPDTDNDDLKDGEEIIITTTERIDSESGNIVNQVYVRMNSNPLKEDSDGDGYNDAEDPRPFESDVITYSLSDSYNFVRIPNLNPSNTRPTDFYGGDQSWYDENETDDKLGYGSCGTVAAANTLAYMSTTEEKYNNLYNYSDFSKESFLSYMIDVYEVVTPFDILAISKSVGVWPMSYFEKRTIQFAKSQGVELEGVRDSSKYTLENVENYIARGLKSDSPVCLLIGFNYSLQNQKIYHIDGSERNGEYTIKQHWVTITEMEKDLVTGKTTVKAQTWGGYAELDLESIVEGENLYQCVLFFE